MSFIKVTEFETNIQIITCTDNIDRVDMDVDGYTIIHYKITPQVGYKTSKVTETIDEIFEMMKGQG